MSISPSSPLPTVFARMCHPSRPLTGHTFGVLSGRYIFSLPGEIRVPVSELTLEKFVDLVRSIRDDITARELDNCAPGVWFDKDTGAWVFDTSTATDDRAHALAMAREYGQLAIYDVVEDDDIQVH